MSDNDYGVQLQENVYSQDSRAIKTATSASS
jgi:hypothetical protein